MFGWIKRLLCGSPTQPVLRSPDRKLNELPEARDAEAGRWPDWPSGVLRHSLRTSGVLLYRYHPKRYLQRGEKWYRMFWDLDYKWEAHSRFAGNHVVPGHFFSLSEAGARAELHAYDQPIADYALMTFKVSLDDVLDLTSMDALQWFYQQHFGTGGSVHWMLVLDSFLDQRKGGDQFNTYAASCAVNDGYHGIVFFGARAVHEYWEKPGEMTFYGGPRNPNLAGLELELMRSDESCINEVVFFAHNVVRMTEEVRLDGDTICNPHFGKSTADIDAVFSADTTKPADLDLDYSSSRYRAQSVFWRGPRPSIETRPGAKGDAPSA